MNRSSWQRAKQIFDESRGLSPGERIRFVDHACAGNEELQKQVQQLLASYESDFLEDTVLGAAEVLVSPVLPDGTEIGRYKIREMIGSGGMGQVFLAADTELNRPVAFKVLHYDVADDKERTRRFIQEAKAASALNHPNILTIHEIGSFNGARFIVSEFVDGETLRDRMRNGLTVTESVEIICQVATALQAAHAAGIVHRDIKPENVMIRRDGLVKVLDFGLAKLTEADDLPIDWPTAFRIHTSPGLVMGTVAYMSPEQARGQAVDARTDLWSLGVVFHEMLTGKSPFDGVSATDLITSILSTETTPADLDSLPPELTPICQKALTKEKEKRYQSAHDLLEDLKGEKKRMEYAIQPSPFITSPTNDELKTQLIRPQRTLSAEYIVTTVKRHKFATLAAALAIVAGVIGLSVYRYNGATPSPRELDSLTGAIDAQTTEKDLKMSRVPASGNVFEIAISPDGKYVAYTTGDRDHHRIHVKELTSQRDIEIVPDSSVESNWFFRLVFTPDSQNLLYQQNKSGNRDIFKVPVAGGTPVKIANKTWSASISPDGLSMASFRNVHDNEDRIKGAELAVSKVDGRDERILQRTLSGKDDPIVCAVPIWSPDSKWLACAFQHGNLYQIHAINVADGTTKPLSNQKWANANGGVWMPDNTLVISGSVKSNEPPQLWRVSEAEARQVTVDAVGYTGLSATRDGKILVTVQSRQRSNLWISPSSDPSRAVQITTSGEMRNFYPLRDGKIAFTSEITDPAQLWLGDREGKDRRQLTFGDTRIGGPTITPDGKYIVYGVFREDGFHTHRMNIDGTDAREINATPARCPTISQDSKWLYCFSWKQENGVNSIYKISIDGGPAILQAKVRVSGAIDITPRGDRIATLITDSESTPPAINIFDINGRLLKLIPVSRTVINNDVALKWTPDGRRIAYVDVSNGTGNIWTVSADGKGRPKPFTNFTAPGVISFKWPYEGKELFMLRRESTSDAMMITNKGN